jgi:Tol biopolymer transport system component
VTTKGCIIGCGIVASGVSLVLLVLAFTIALFVRRSMTYHDRPGGHADVNFGVSPDGGKLVFSAAGDGGSDLYVLDLNSLAITRLAATQDYELAPRFSPDGRSVVYCAGNPGDRADHLFVRKLDRNEVVQLTAEDANDASPEFSPDGSHIVFTRDKTFNWGGLAAHGWGGDRLVCVINADGSGFRQITNKYEPTYDPHYSPDGRAILFWGEDGAYTVAADGSQSPKRLIRRKVREPVYSPDGQSITLVMGHYAPDCEIYVCGSDGMGFKQITDTGKRQFPAEGAGCFRPAFTPDGRRIIFFLESWPVGPTDSAKENLWEIGVDGGAPRKLADYGLFDDPLHWKPDPSKGVSGPAAR